MGMLRPISGYPVCYDIGDYKSGDNYVTKGFGELKSAVKGYQDYFWNTKS